jgi:RNA polymerase sigma factor (TIGR02999 family)
MVGQINPMSDITIILESINRGETQAAEKLLPLVYDELRKLARARMAQESAGNTLQPTALVHEAWLELVGDGDKNWKSRAYFFAAAAEAMRRILVWRARGKARLKRGNNPQKLNIEDVEIAGVAPDEKILLVNEALENLERTNPERARVVVMKFFGGMTNKEVAETMGIGERTVERHWMFARSWLFEKIKGGI